MKTVRSSQGFFLIEVLIAFTVIVFGATACFYGFSRNLKVSQQLDDRQVRIEGLQASLLKAVR